jgi:hypothetical protein
MSPNQPSSGPALLFRDTTAALLVLNEARNRLLTRLFGTSRDESLILSIILIGALADALHEKAAAARNVPGPKATDVAMAAAVLNEGAHRATGDWARGTPFFVPLLAFAVIWKYHPLAKVSLRGARASVHGAVTEWRKAKAYGSHPADGGVRGLTS